MGGYATLNALDNPVPDATAVADTLEGIGFDVTRALDMPLSGLRETMQRFAFEAETADLALIYFAGHGVQVAGENFLLPVDADAQTNEDVQAQSVSLKDFLRTVDGARRMRIVILDSCRDNPLGGGIEVGGPRAAEPGGLAPLVTGKEMTIEQFITDTGLTTDQLLGVAPIEKAEVKYMYELGKPLVKPELLQSLPTQMYKFHQLYMEMSATGREMIGAAGPAATGRVGTQRVAGAGRLPLQLPGSGDKMRPAQGQRRRRNRPCQNCRCFPIRGIPA